MEETAYVNPLRWIVKVERNAEKPQNDCALKKYLAHVIETTPDSVFEDSYALLEQYFEEMQAVYQFLKEIYEKPVP